MTEVEETNVVMEGKEGEEWKLAGKGKKRKRKDTEKMEEGQAEETVDAEATPRPYFPPVKREKLQNGVEVRKISVPAHRYVAINFV